MSTRTTQRDIDFAMVRAAHANHRKYYNPNPKFAKALETSSLRRTLVTDYKTATQCKAWIIERPFYGNYQHAWQVAELGDAGCTRDIGGRFFTAEAFREALSLLEAVRR